MLRAELTGPEGRVCAWGEVLVSLMSGEAEARLDLSVADVRLWDLDDPALYRLTVTVLRDGAPCDSAWEQIGFRSFRFSKEEGFVLNGRARKLYGADLHHDGGVCFGSAVPRGVIRERLLALRRLGCNAIRCSHGPHPQALYELCDELGFAVIDELYDKWCGSSIYFGLLFEEDRFEDLRAMVARDRDHPCVVLWSLGNEL